MEGLRPGKLPMRPDCGLWGPICFSPMACGVDSLLQMRTKEMILIMASHILTFGQWYDTY
jgi:hypothetical protein